MAGIEQVRAEVLATVREHDESLHRGIDAKYNLLRVSERRWRVVRVSSVAPIYHGLTDVVTFECVSEPLPYDAALAALKHKRGVAAKE
jgi:hypothetical protein